MKTVLMTSHTVPKSRAETRVESKIKSLNPKLVE